LKKRTREVQRQEILLQELEQNQTTSNSKEPKQSKMTWLEKSKEKEEKSIISTELSNPSKISMFLTIKQMF